MGRQIHINDAVAGEMDWKPTVVRQWKSVCLYWSKLAAMNNNRLNKRISLWAFEKAGRSCKNWMYSVSQFLEANNFGQFSRITKAIPSSRRFVTDFENNIYENFDAVHNRTMRFYLWVGKYTLTMPSQEKWIGSPPLCVSGKVCVFTGRN